MAIHRHCLDDTTAQNRGLKGRLFNVKENPTPETTLFQRPAKHLLTCQTQKVCVPNHQNPTPDACARGHKGHPLSKPFRKVLHTVRDGGIHFFKVALVSVCGFVGVPKRLRLSVVQTFIENRMWGWKVHCGVTIPYFKPKHRRTQSSSPQCRPRQYTASSL